MYAPAGANHKWILIIVLILVLLLAIGILVYRAKSKAKDAVTDGFTFKSGFMSKWIASLKFKRKNA